MSARCFCFPCYLFHIIELILHSACHKTFAEYFWQNLVVTETWLDKKDVHTDGQLPLADKLWLRSYHIFKKFKRKVLACLQTKHLKRFNYNHNAFMRWVKKTFMCKQRRDVAWQLSWNWNVIHLFGRSTPKHPKKTAKYELCFLTLPARSGLWATDLTHLLRSSPIRLKQ